MSSIHKCVFYFHRIWIARVKENNEKKGEKKERATLDPSLHFGSPNDELSFKLFLLVWTNWLSVQNDAM
jgi:hypothetical protein